MCSNEQFRIDSLEDYHTIISNLLEHSDLKELGNPYLLDIDYDTLATTTNLLVEGYGKELKDHIRDYSEFRLAHSLVYNTLAYALVNHRRQVGISEVVGMFQAWTYVPVSMHVKMLSQILNSSESCQQNMGGITTPKKLCKIIPFPDRK